MKKLTAKKIYEKIVLSGYKPSEEDQKLLMGTHWYHKLNGTTPSPKEAFGGSFKKYYETEAGPVEKCSRSDLADSILDRVEDKFGLHFSNFTNETSKPQDLPTIKDYAFSILQHAQALPGDKKSIARVINNADSVESLMVRLGFLAGQED